MTCAATEEFQTQAFGLPLPKAWGNVAASCIPDATIVETQVFTMTQNLVVGAPIGPRAVGDKLSLVFIDANGGYTISWNAVYRNAPTPLSGQCQPAPLGGVSLGRRQLATHRRQQRVRVTSTPGVAPAVDGGPCWACGFAPRCAAEQLACEAFSMYVHGEFRSRWATAPRAPTHAKLLAIEAEREHPRAGPPLRRRPATVALIR